MVLSSPLHVLRSTLVASANENTPRSVANSAPFVVAAPVSSGGKKHPGKAVIAGGVSGGIEIAITFPTEYVKTQLQLDERSATPKYKGPIDCVKVTVRDHGVRGLYRGLSSLLYGSIPKASIRFAAFEQYATLLREDDGTLSSGRRFTAGLGAGVTEAILIVCPMEAVKVKMIHDQTLPKPQYRGFIHGIQTIIKQEGLAGAYGLKGLPSTMLKQGSNQAIRFFVFGELKKYWLGDPNGQWNNPAESMVAGGIAGAASVFGNTPVDVIKTRMTGLDSHKYTSSIDCAKKIWKNEGFMAFYKGTGPRLARVTADVALVMTLYEQIMKGLDAVWKTD